MGAGHNVRTLLLLTLLQCGNVLMDDDSRPVIDLIVQVIKILECNNNALQRHVSLICNAAQISWYIDQAST
jgi:hypothetical protein